MGMAGTVMHRPASPSPHRHKEYDLSVIPYRYLRVYSELRIPEGHAASDPERYAIGGRLRSIRTARLCSILPVRGGRSPLPLICLRCTSIDHALKSEIERPIQFSTE